MHSLVPLLYGICVLTGVSCTQNGDQNWRAIEMTTPSIEKERCIETVAPKVEFEPATEIRNVSLVGGVSSCSGLLQLHLRNSTTVGLCLHGSSSRESELVCQTLHCGRMQQMVPGSYFLTSSLAVWEHRLDCRPNDTVLADCHKVPHQCQPQEFLGIVCEDANQQFRLGPSLDRCSGTLYLFHRGSWRVVGGDLSAEDRERVCVILNCGHAVDSGDVTATERSEVELENVNCLSQRGPGKKCSIREPGTYGLSRNHITCKVGHTPVFRLVDGISQCDGNVEIFHQGSWVPVCHDIWGKKEIGVVCAQSECVGQSPAWERTGVLGKNHSQTPYCVTSRNPHLRSKEHQEYLWDLQEDRGTFQQLNITCPGRKVKTPVPKVVAGSSGLVTASVLLLVLILLLVTLIWGWRHYRGNGGGVFRRQQTQRQWIGPTGAAGHTVSFHRNNNANTRPVSATSAGSHSYTLEPTSTTAYPALERRANMAGTNRGNSSDSDYDFFDTTTQRF